VREARAASTSGDRAEREESFTTLMPGPGYPRAMRGLRIGAIARLATAGGPVSCAAASLVAVVVVAVAGVSFAAVSLGAVSFGAGGQSQSAPSPQAVPPAVTYGDTTTISGQLPSSTTADTVALQRRLAGEADYRVVATRATGADRSFSFVDRPRGNALYRVAGSTPSAPVAVSVRTAVGMLIDTSVPRRGGTVRFSGTVRPDTSGSAGQVERQSVTGAYIAIAQLDVSPTGGHVARYARRIHISRSGRYRVRVAGTRSVAAGVSRTVVLHVRRP
jgi:hypothetical protein